MLIPGVFAAHAVGLEGMENATSKPLEKHRDKSHIYYLMVFNGDLMMFNGV